MKITRSVKCSTRFANNSKIESLENILVEYSKVVNIFIENFWVMKELPSTASLLKPIVDIPLNKTWASARLRKVAAREAIAMISSLRERWKHSPKKMSMPIHRGNKMQCSSTIGELQDSESSFDMFFKIGSVGEKIKLLLPIKKHKQFNKWAKIGKLLNSFIITKNYIQFCFEIDTGPKREEGKTLGIDTGIKALATTSDGRMYGREIEALIKKINQCQHGSKRQKRLRIHLKEYINRTCKKIFDDNPRLCRVVVERLKNMNFKSKRNRKLPKQMRKTIGSWNYSYWLSRLERECEHRRSRFTSVNPSYTSQSCNQCGHTNRANRSKQDSFCCVECGHTDHADINAAKNILDLGTSLVYRRGL